MPYGGHRVLRLFTIPQNPPECKGTQKILKKLFSKSLLNEKYFIIILSSLIVHLFDLLSALIVLQFKIFFFIRKKKVFSKFFKTPPCALSEPVVIEGWGQRQPP